MRKSGPLLSEVVELKTNDPSPEETVLARAEHVELKLPNEAHLRAIVELSVRVATEAGEYREVAFKTLLETLLQLELNSSATLAPRVEGRTPTDLSTETRGRRGVARRPAKLNQEASSRIRAALDAPPEVVGEFVSEVQGLPKTSIGFAVLAFAKKVGLEGLTLPEIREIVSAKLRMGVADGTLRGSLSVAPASQIGRTANNRGETIYTLMIDGERALAAAAAAAKKRRSKPMDSPDRPDLSSQGSTPGTLDLSSS